MPKEPVTAALRDQLSPRVRVGLACDPKEDRARQEFKQETETSYILQRFGAGQAFGPLPSGEVDYDLDLQRAFALIRESRDAWRRLPPEAQRFGSWQKLQEAIEAGEYPPKPAAPAAAGAAGAGGSASDSAPVAPRKGDAAS